MLFVWSMRVCVADLHTQVRVRLCTLHKKQSAAVRLLSIITNKRVLPPLGLGIRCLPGGVQQALAPYML